MKKILIDKNLIEKILDTITKKTPFPKDIIYHEIQDDFQLLFISIKIDNFDENEVNSSIKIIGEFLNQIMPQRDDDYSWVIGLKRKGQVVESCFGGNSNGSNWLG
ncbi:hypothetical protein [Janthinobacterium agaricidamnosum]|uniref:Uncharacterized protein n=1 Tax=Janthinobacterium agaricidamnosum NBRC 102515 = DSM 9628 TaxID=1349767 RepID=W0V1D2_9BURK|nr:hypothetical protein [Janthinobacterium agaricidamnosum]CDG81420.1 hypothetical protein GJA_761 [Janthinobacterium agaricidamnosum NBRC 102515 = DSM 9628]